MKYKTHLSTLVSIANAKQHNLEKITIQSTLNTTKIMTSINLPKKQNQEKVLVLHIIYVIYN